MLYSAILIYLVKNGCVRGKVVKLGQKLLYSGKMVLFGQSGCFREVGCFWAKVVVFGQKWLYSVKRCCNRANVVV